MKISYFLITLLIVTFTACSSNAKKDVCEPLPNGYLGYRMHPNDSVKSINENLSFCNIYLNKPFNSKEWLSQNDSISSYIEPLTKYLDSKFIGNVYKLYIHSMNLDVEIETFGDIVMSITAKSDKRNENLVGLYLKKYGEFNCEEIVNKSLDFSTYTWDYKNQQLRVYIGEKGTDITYIDKTVKDKMLNYLTEESDKQNKKEKEINSSFADKI